MTATGADTRLCFMYVFIVSFRFFCFLGCMLCSVYLFCYGFATKCTISSLISHCVDVVYLCALACVTFGGISADELHLGANEKEAPADIDRVRSLVITKEWVQRKFNHLPVSLHVWCVSERRSLNLE